MKTLTTLRKRYPKGSVKYNEIQNQINIAYAGGTEEAIKKYGDKGIRRDEYTDDEEMYSQLELNPETEEFEPIYEEGMSEEELTVTPENTPETGYTSREEFLAANPSEEPEKITKLRENIANSKGVKKKILQARLNRLIKKAMK